MKPSARVRALRVARRDDDETRADAVRRRLPGEHVFVHRPAEAAVGFQKRSSASFPRNDESATASPSSEGSSTEGILCSDRKTLVLVTGRSVCSTNRSIHSLPATTQLPIVPSGAITTALGVPFAS